MKIKKLFPTLRHYINFLLMWFFFMFFISASFALRDDLSLDALQLKIILGLAALYFYNEWLKGEK